MILELLSKPGTYRYWLGAVIVLAALVALCGITLLPLESHEAFVLASAQTMHDNQDWIVPWFNGEPRLTKPPLQYWLTALTAWASGGIDQIQPWHGRFPSGLAAIGIAALTVVSGRKLFGTREGLLAGIMLASSSGFYYYAHSARPEMVYAFFCTAALACYIHADKAEEGGFAQRVWGILIWVALAFATLTKGPHVPLVFLAVFAGHIAFRKLGWRGLLRRLQPFWGLALFLLIALPWWWLLQHKVANLQDSQLSGKLLKPALSNALDPYYLWRPFQLMLPWTLLVPALWLVGWKRLRESHGFLMALAVLVALILSFGPQKRWYYMLPVLAPMFLVLAAGVGAMLERLGQRRGPVRHVGWVLAAIPLVVVLVINTPAVASKDKTGDETLAIAARAEIDKGKALAVWEVSSSEVFIYHARTKVIDIDRIGDLPAVIAQAGSRGLALVVPTERLGELPPDLHYRLVKQVGSKSHGLVLLDFS